MSTFLDDSDIYTKGTGVVKMCMIEINKTYFQIDVKYLFTI